MKFATFVFLSMAVVLVNCGHMFLGTNIQRMQIFYERPKYPPTSYTERIEYVNFTLSHWMAKMARIKVRLNMLPKPHGYPASLLRRGNVSPYLNPHGSIPGRREMLVWHIIISLVSLCVLCGYLFVGS